MLLSLLACVRLLWGVGELWSLKLVKACMSLHTWWGLLPLSVGLRGLFDAALQVYSGNTVQRTVSQPEG